MKRFINFGWIIFVATSVTLFVFMLTMPPLNFGGDIAEYYGITETLLIDQSLHLTPTTISILSKTLQPAYFTDPGYYISGLDGERYPVHFVFYSLLAFPVRLILKLFSAPEVNALRLTNLLILTLASWYILSNYAKSSFQKIAYITIVYLSPLLWFLSWPGPDIYYLSLMLVSIFLFFHQRYVLAILLMSLASWHSQPLIVTVLGMLFYYALHVIRSHKNHHGIYITKGFVKNMLLSSGIAAFCLIPYAYNLLIFGTLTPWTILADGWTELHGFGLHNASLQKLFEQFFDLNFGLFWYAPLILLTGLYLVIKKGRQHAELWYILLLLFPITAIFYQTNPAWHYGTAGFGPSRHAIFLLPFFIYCSYVFLQHVRHKAVWILLFIFAQLPLIILQNFAFPNILNTLQHSPYAAYALNTAPSVYNPTPEIFVDRTLQTDDPLPKSAIYKHNGECKKAYVLLTDTALLVNECGDIPDAVKEKLDNPYRRKANFSRQVRTTEATFWPDPGSCAPSFYPSKEKPFVCMRTIIEAVRETHADIERLENLDGLPGVWKLKAGKPITITIPPGYFIDHKALEGVYVTY
jgi:hypothetical protein